MLKYNFYFLRPKLNFTVKITKSRNFLLFFSFEVRYLGESWSDLVDYFCTILTTVFLFHIKEVNVSKKLIFRKSNFSPKEMQNWQLCKIQTCQLICQGPLTEGIRQNSNIGHFRLNFVTFDNLSYNSLLFTDLFFSKFINTIQSEKAKIGFW